MDNRIQGDKFISGYNIDLWRLHQKVLLTYNCYTLFTEKSYDCSRGISGYIRWFVPAHHLKAAEIRNFIERELEEYDKEAYDIPELLHHNPGTKVKVTIFVDLYHGIEPYLEKRKLKQLTEVATQEFFDKIAQQPSAQKKDKIIPWLYRIRRTINFFLDKK